MNVYYKGKIYEITDKEEEALTSFGADVAAGDMTQDEAIYCVLRRSIHDSWELPAP